MDNRPVRFEAVVQDCAVSKAIIALFNISYGRALQAPVSALLQDEWPADLSDEELETLIFFLNFVHREFWLKERSWQDLLNRSNALTYDTSQHSRLHAT